VQEVKHVAVKHVTEAVGKGFFAGLETVANAARKTASSSPLPVALALFGIAAVASGSYFIYKHYSKKED